LFGCERADACGGSGISGGGGESSQAVRGGGLECVLAADRVSAWTAATLLLGPCMEQRNISVDFVCTKTVESPNCTRRKKISKDPRSEYKFVIVL
jgi:hypothetical protein